mgnify:CR=1 FL=1
MRRAALPLALCCVVLLSGCSAFLPGGHETTSPPTGNASDYPPGLVVNGVSDPGALADAHAAVLANASFAYSHSTRATRPGGPPSHRVETLHLSRNRTRFTSSVNVSGPVFYGDRREAAWGNGTTVATRTRLDGETRYYAGKRPQNIDGNVSRRSRLLGFYRSFSFAVERTDDGYTLTSTGVRRHAFSQRFREVSNASLVLHLDPRGVVRSYRLTFDGTSNGDTYHVVETFALTQVGDVAIERPPWVEEALSNRSTTTTTER